MGNAYEFFRRDIHLCSCCIPHGFFISSLSPVSFPPKDQPLLADCEFRDRKTGKEDKMLQILIINDGYRPVIISQCEYTSSPGSGSGNIGIYDVLKAPYGIADIVLPVLLEPAKPYTINVFHASVLNREDMSINDIYVIDAKDKKYYVSKSDLEAAKREADEIAN
jgi:hypothetical protein